MDLVFEFLNRSKLSCDLHEDACTFPKYVYVLRIYEKSFLFTVLTAYCLEETEAWVA